MLLFCLSELDNNLYLDCLTVGQVVAFTDDGWRANLHGLHLVYDLILFCFLRVVSCVLTSQLWFCNGFLDLVSFGYP